MVLPNMVLPNRVLFQEKQNETIFIDMKLQKNDIATFLVLPNLILPNLVLPNPIFSNLVLPNFDSQNMRIDWYYHFGATKNGTTKE